jgi:amino-acid N-acetyltransferase
MSENIQLRSATKKDLALVSTLLQENQLPDRDIYENSVHLFIASIASKDIGIGGLELYDNICLLRSLVVRNAFRGKGYGKELTCQLLDRARDKGIKEVYLLTTTAAEFFSKIGFERVDVYDTTTSTRSSSSSNSKYQSVY